MVIWRVRDISSEGEGYRIIRRVRVININSEGQGYLFKGFIGLDDIRGSLERI